MVKISSENSPQNISNKQAASAKLGQAKLSSTQNAQSKDNFSQEAISEIRKIIENSPAVDQKLINKLKAQINQGQYKIDPTKLAESILKSSLQDG